MTVKELIEKLKEMPQDFDVVTLDEDWNKVNVETLAIDTEDKTVII